MEVLGMITLKDGKVFDEIKAGAECANANANWVRKNNFGSIAWNTVYNTEEDIINDLANIYVPANRQPFTKLFNGYEYIFSFATYVQKGWTLSEKQMRQCKRLAAEIRKAYIVSQNIK